MNKKRRLLILACLSFIAIYCSSVSVSAETPELVVNSYEVTDGEAIEGGSFELTLEIKNVSKSDTIYNALISVLSDDDVIYSDYGMTNQGYIDSIRPQATESIKFTLKVADLAPDTVRTKVLFTFNDKDNLIDTNNVYIWIPIETKGKINISEFTMTENILTGDVARLNMTITNNGDSNLSTIRIHLSENGSEILNELISKSLAVEATTSFETYLDTLDVGAHEIEAAIEYTSENGETYTSNPRIYQINVTENIPPIAQESNSAQETRIIYIGAIAALMVVCLIIIVRQIRVKK